MKLFLILIFLINAFFVSGANAATGESSYFQYLSESDKKIYQETYESCAKRNERTFTDFHFTEQESEILLGTFGDISYAIDETYSQGPKEGFKVFIQTKGLGMRLYQLLQSQGFMLALKTCFQGDARKENIYVSELLLIDAVMKGIIVTASTLGAVKAFKYLISKRKILASYLKIISQRPWIKTIFKSLVGVGLYSYTKDPEEIQILKQSDEQLELLKKEIESLK